MRSSRAARKWCPRRPGLRSHNDSVTRDVVTIRHVNRGCSRDDDQCRSGQRPALSRLEPASHGRFEAHVGAERKMDERRDSKADRLGAR